MPNWCITRYVIEGHPTELDDLYNKLLSLEEMEQSLLPNGFGKNWLGNIVHLFGGDSDKIYCRGDFSLLERYGDSTLRIETCTAWAPMNEVWDFILKQYPSCKYYYCAEENGCCYYVTNDAERTYFERFFIDDFSIGQDYYNDENEVFKYISERIEKPVSSWEEMKKLLDEFNEQNEDPIYVHEFEIV